MSRSVALSSTAERVASPVGFNMASRMQYAVLHNGAKMPLIGYGTHLVTEGSLEKSMETALNAGYRHFDTAALYNNEEEIGNVLKSWISAGKVKREDLFIVTKLPPSGNRAGSVEKWITRSLQKLQLDYVDLYLIHKPFGVIERGYEAWPRDDQGNIIFDHTTDHLALWKAMEAQVDAGRAKAIGLSDFSQQQIQRILENCRIKPANLQIELHLIHQQKPLVEFSHKNGITVTAYCPLGSPAKQALFKDVNIPDLLGHPVVVEAAAKYQKSAGQILLKHIVQRGISAIPKSLNSGRINDNIEIFDFTLSQNDVRKLDALDEGEEGKVFLLTDLLKGVEDHPEYPYKGLKGHNKK